MEEKNTSFEERSNSLAGENLQHRIALARKILIKQAKFSPDMIAFIQSLLGGINFSDLSNLEKWKTNLMPRLIDKNNLDMTFLINCANAWLLLGFDNQNSYAKFVGSLGDKLQINMTSKSILADHRAGFKREGFIETMSHNPIVMFIYMLHLGGILTAEEQRAIMKGVKEDEQSGS